MRIGFITTYFYPVLGGAETNCFYLARELAKKHEVHVFTSTTGAKEEETIENIHIHRSKTFFRFGYYAALYPSLMKNLLRYQLEIVHVHSFGFLWHDICLLIKKLQSPKTKFVITPHGPFMALNNYRSWKRILKFAVNVLEYFPNKMYDRVIEVNPAQRKWLPKYGFKKENIIFIPNGIPQEFTKKKGRLNLLSGRVVVSYVGRVQRYKGLDQVISVLPELIKIEPKLLFVMAGHPEEMDGLVRLAKEKGVGEHVLFLGKIPEREKEELLESSRIFVFPSKWEAFGIVVLEAMAKGVPIVSTKTEGGKFLIEEGKNGFLFDYGDHAVLRNILIRLLTDKKIRKEISEKNRQKAKRFVWEKIAQDLEEEYRRIL